MREDKLAASPHDVTRLLASWRAGDQEALRKLTSIVYRELRQIAAQHMQQERWPHTLQATELVGELYLRLVDQRAVPTDRAHFFSIAALAMRRLLIDRARARLTEKRGGGRARIPLEDVTLMADERPDQLLALDEALTRFSAVYRRESDVVMYRYFSGFKIDEIAELLDISRATVHRDLQFAKAWLHREITHTPEP